jgi:hypothetical protein
MKKVLEFFPNQIFSRNLNNLQAKEQHPVRVLFKMQVNLTIKNGR